MTNANNACNFIYGEAVENFTVLCREEHNTVDEDGDEHYAETTVLKAGTDISDDQLAEYIRSEYPEEHCQHSHDCCGKWYAGSASFKRVENLTIISQSWRPNI